MSVNAKSRKSAGVTNYINYACVIFKLYYIIGHDSMHNTRTLEWKQLNGIQPSFILLFTPDISYHIKMFWMIMAGITCKGTPINPSSSHTVLQVSIYHFDWLPNFKRPGLIKPTLFPRVSLSHWKIVIRY